MLEPEKGLFFSEAFFILDEEKREMYYETEIFVEISTDICKDKQPRERGTI